MELASLIEDLGKACGLELTLDEGRCTLRFDGEHDVTIERDGNAVWERTGEIVLWKRFDAFTDYPDFEAAINAFLAQLIHWKARIDALPSVAVSASATFTPGGIMV